MANFSNYGLSYSSKSKIKGGIQSAGAAAAPYFATPIQNTENPFYETMYRVKKVTSIATLVIGDYYNASALQSYNNMDFSGMGSANADYLNKIGCSKKEAEYQVMASGGGKNGMTAVKASDFSSKDFSTLRAKGTVDVNGTTYSVKDKQAFNQAVQRDYSNQTNINHITGAGSKKEQLRAMQDIYQHGLNSMQQSNNLVSIHDASRRGADAVRSECAKVEHSLTKQINDIAKDSSNKDYINSTLRKNQLTSSELDAFNRAINKDKTLTSAQKNDLKQMMADRNEVKCFVKSGAINGGKIDTMKGKINYGKRMLGSAVLGHDMQRGVDAVRMTVKVTKLAAKTTFALGRSGGYVSGAVGNVVARPAAKAIDAIASKATGMKQDNASNFLKHAREKRKKDYADRKEWRNAKKSGRLCELKKKRKQEKFNKREADLDKKIKRAQSKMSGAKGNSRAYDRYNRKTERLKNRKDAVLRKRERHNRIDKFKSKVNSKVNNAMHKLGTPFRAIKKPFTLISKFLNAIKAKVMGVIASMSLVLIVVPMAAGFLLMGIGAMMAGLTGGLQDMEQMTNIGYPAEVEQWRPYVTDRCEFYNDTYKDGDLTQFVNWALAMIWQESSGNANVLSAEHPPDSGIRYEGDVMQSIESGNWENGTPSNWNSMSNQEKSIDAGIREFVTNLNKWKPEGPSDYDTMMLLIQGYNYGADGWYTYCKNNNIKKWTLKDSTKYSLMRAAEKRWVSYGTPTHAQLVMDKYQSGGTIGGTAGSGEVCNIAGQRGVLETANNQVSIKEDPPGTNNVPYNTWYYGHEVQDPPFCDNPKYPWCCAFVSWVFHQSGNDAAIGGEKYAGCSALETDARNGVGGMKAFTDKKKLQPGDLIIFRNGQHIGIVASYDKKTDKLVTIEGNTSMQGFDSEGGMVAKKESESGTCYIRPNWGAAVKKAKKAEKAVEKANKKAQKRQEKEQKKAAKEATKAAEENATTE